jgi:hypothetical protein
MSTIRRSRVSSRSIVIAVLASAAIASCGSTGHLSRTAANAKSRTNPALQFSQCMRTNGVPNLPDPGPSGYQTSGINLQSPAAERAFNVCVNYLHQPAHPPPTPESVQEEDLKFAQCMRANGVPNFPDPDANGNIQFPITSPIPQSPAFQHAQNGPCKKYLSR